MEKRKQKTRSKTAKGSGNSAQRRATLRDLEVTDRDQEGVRGGYKRDPARRPPG